jgi:hypothetical protein
MSIVTSSESFKIMKAIVVLPEFFNFGLLGIGLFQMYHGIEISHPVYTILFTNLCVAFSSSFVGIMSFFYLTDNSYILGKNL